MFVLQLIFLSSNMHTNILLHGMQQFKWILNCCCIDCENWRFFVNNIEYNNWMHRFMLEWKNIVTVKTEIHSACERGPLKLIIEYLKTEYIQCLWKANLACVQKSPCTTQCSSSVSRQTQNKQKLNRCHFPDTDSYFQTHVIGDGIWQSHSPTGPTELSSWSNHSMKRQACLLKREKNATYNLNRYCHYPRTQAELDVTPPGATGFRL